MNLICLSKCKTVSWANSLAVNVASMLSPLSILFINACIIWIWIFWSNTSSFGHELIFCCSLCIVYIGIRSSEPIDFSDMLEDCNNLQLRDFSKELNSWVKLFVRRNIGDIDLYLLWQLWQDSARGWCGYRNAATQVWCCCLIVTHLARYHMNDSTNVNRVTFFKSDLFINIDIIWSTCIGCINDLLMPRREIVGVW